MLPIVQRELQTAARNRRLYLWRSLTGLAVLLIVPLIVINAPLARRWTGLFTTLGHIALFLCLLEGIRKTADSISIERREGTLGLLFLSTLTGFDIIIGKLASATIRSLTTLLVFIPLLSITLLVGGTTGGEFWRGILVLILVLVMSLSVCLCFSAMSRDGAVTASVVFLILLCFLPIFSQIHNATARWVLPLNPFWTLHSASDSSYTLDPWIFWRGIIYLATLILLSLGVASFILPRNWQDRPIKSRANPRLSSSLPPKFKELRRAMLDRNPIMWLMFNARSHHNFRLSLIALLSLVIIGTALLVFVIPQFGVPVSSGVELFLPTFAVGVLFLVVSIRVASATSRNFFEARHNGAMELILSTPVKVRDIINGQWLALRADLLPALIIFLLLSGLMLGYWIFVAGDWQLLYAIKPMAEAVLGTFTIAAMGIWMGLSSKSPGRALFKTLAFGFVAPYLICTPTLVNQLVLLLIAWDKVQVQFRRFIAEQYLASPTLSTISPAQPNTPPVIR